jgi:hypothetical protein
MTPTEPQTVEKKGWTPPKVWSMRSGTAEGGYGYYGSEGAYYAS